MPRTLSFIAAALLVFGCTSTQTAGSYQPDRPDDLEVATVDVSVPQDSLAIAWRRAKQFLGEHTSARIQTHTGEVIETYGPDPEFTQFGYRIYRMDPENGAVILRIECWAGRRYSLIDQAETNAQRFARYVETGTLQ